MLFKRIFALLLLFLLAQPASAQVQLTEFMASNSKTLADDFGQYEDWIELYNASSTNVNLLDWALTDNPGNLFKWRFPATDFPPRTYLLVFASNRDRRTPGAPLHTNFKLDAAGEYLALVNPNGTVVSEFAPAYPPQLPDVSFGLGVALTSSKLVTSGTVGSLKVPTDGNLGLNWASNSFLDAGWSRATNGIGFETGQSEEAGPVPGDVLGDNPPAYWRLNESGGIAINSGYLGAAANGQLLAGVTAAVAGPRPPAFPGFETNNNAVRFDGNGSKVEIPYQAELNPSGAFTVEAWVKPSRKGGNTGCPVSSLDTSSGRRGYMFYQDYDAKNQWEFLLGNDSTYIARAIGGTVDTNNWQYLAGVYDGVVALLYVNGVLCGSSSLSGNFVPNTTEKFTFGARQNVNAYAYAGELDEVAVHGRALSPDEIANRYRMATNSSSTKSNYTGLIQTDVRASMSGVNSSVYLRLPFTVTNLAEVDQLTLRVKYDDGFAAFLNGIPAAGANTATPLAWNSTASAVHPVAEALQFQEYDLTGLGSSLSRGTNLLALQGLNCSATNADFLLLTELESSSVRYVGPGRYFVTPTPRGMNGLGEEDLGPILSFAGHSPFLPGTNDGITVTCRVGQSFAAIASVTLNWRVMFGPTTATPMFDDGLHGDGLAGDGIYGATIPNRSGLNPTYTAGQMVRWYITATDALSRTSRWPLFESPTNSAEYLGTVVQSDYVTSALPVVHLFVSNYVNGVGVDNSDKTGARAAVFFDGELYDNVFMCVRGNSTAGYYKKSHRFEFNPEHPFRHPGPGDRLNKTSFTADYPDPAYMRQGLTFWLCGLAGAPGPFYYPMRLQMNGQFYQLANHNDLHGGQLLERIGYNPEGALYNAAGTVEPSYFSTGGFDKKTRQWDSNADYEALTYAISANLPTGTRQTNIFDLLDLPEVVNYMAVARFTHENDDVWANMSLYHDNDGDGLWRIIPFDMNLTWGAAYMDSDLFSGIQVTNDNVKSFPLYGSSQALPEGMWNWNRMYDVVFMVPQTREMFLRRLRTLLDTYVKPPGTPPEFLPIEQHILEWQNLIAEEAQRDRAKWGWPGKGGQSNFDPGIDLTNGVQSLIQDFLNKRRTHFYGKHSVTNTALPIGVTKANNAGIPLGQPLDASVSLLACEYNPASGNQDEEFICLTNANNYAVDISGWKLSGGVSHTMQPGTVVPAGSALYLSPNVVAFRRRSSAPRGGMGLFVQGNYKGHLTARGESLTLADETGRVVSSYSYAGQPSLVQQFLRITEIMYNPAPLPGSNEDPQDFEYLELKNISSVATLNLSGVRLTNGVYFNFSGSAVTTLLPGQTVLVVRDMAAFTARYGAGYSIAGQYTGALNNAGETLRLEDAAGEEVLEFAYNNTWYPVTDGLGFSLVIANEQADWATWGQKQSWRPSAALNGSPGVTDPSPPAVPHVLLNEVLAHTDPPLVDCIELYNPAVTNADIGGWFLTDELYTPKKFRIPPGTSVPAQGYLVFAANGTFGAGANPFLLSEYGEQAYLFSGDANTNLTGYTHGFDFGASPLGVSFGRYLTSQRVEHFVLQSANTLGTNNALPRVGPIVISEVMYHPPDLPNGIDNSQDEFVELQNITGTNVPLYCIFTNETGYGTSAATNTWALAKAVDYNFPTNTVLTNGSRILVVGFDPSTNGNRLASFRALYQVPAEIPVFGPWRGKLDNSGETLELKSPDKPDVTPTNVIVPYITVEKLGYSDTFPWPANSDGLGCSLQRIVPGAYGNDPANWAAAMPTAGQPNAVEAGPFITSISFENYPSRVNVTVVPGVWYVLEYKGELTEPEWQALPPAVLSQGTTLTLDDPTPRATQRFYRVRAQFAP